MFQGWIYRVAGFLLFFSAGVLAWTLFGNRERLLLIGEFHSVAHKGSGQARILATADGRRMLRLLNVRTYPGSDLEVCLVAAPDAEDNDTVRQEGFVCLGGFHPRTGYAAYPLPAGLDLEKYRAVSIWSPEYGVNFTTAPLGH